MDTQPRIAAVVVSYHPTVDDGAFEELLASLVAQCERVYLVDNGTGRAGLGRVPQGVQICLLGENKGIAHAQNVGIRQALADGAEFVYLSDQDSVVPEGAIAALHAHLLELEEAGERVGGVGPWITEDVSGSDDLIYVDTTWGPRRVPEAQLAQARAQGSAIPVAFLLASGALVAREVWEDVGPLNPSYFIDHVDLEWCLRARAAGLEFFVSPRVVLHHHLGQDQVTFPGRRQPIHLHAPVRTYYLARNTLFLEQSGLLPPAWRLGYLVWLAKYAGFNATLAPEACSRGRYLLRGVWDGITRRGGRIDAR